MKTIHFDSEFDETVLGYLKSNYSKRFSKGWKFGESTLAIFVHDEFVMRTGTHQTITVIFEPAKSSGKSMITVIGTGGGDGLLGIDWGSESAAEDTLVKKIEIITRSQN